MIEVLKNTIVGIATVAAEKAMKEGKMEKQNKGFLLGKLYRIIEQALDGLPPTTYLLAKRQPVITFVGLLKRVKTEHNIDFEIGKIMDHFTELPRLLTPDEQLEFDNGYRQQHMEIG
jgi:hypothetical protein